MGGIDVGRWIVSGVAAGAVIWVLEGAGSLLYFEDMQAALEAHGLAMEADAGVWITSIAVCLLAGLTLMFFYAAARPRFDRGRPRP